MWSLLQWKVRICQMHAIKVVLNMPSHIKWRNNHLKKKIPSSLEMYLIKILIWSPWPFYLTKIYSFFFSQKFSWLSLIIDQSNLGDIVIVFVMVICIFHCLLKILKSRDLKLWISLSKGITTPKSLTYYFSVKKITSLFISIKLDLDILIFYKLVPCMTWKDENALNKPQVRLQIDLTLLPNTKCYFLSNFLQKSNENKIKLICQNKKCLKLKLYFQRKLLLFF